METPEAGQNIITRGLPKTGQVTEYQAGDDGTYETGWWKGRLNANNRTRWIAKTIGGDDIVLDRATGLMWAGDGNAAGCNNGATISWANGIIYANGLDFAGFTDWRLPNVKALISILNYGLSTPSIEEPPFTNTFTGSFWSSTTKFSLVTDAWRVTFVDGIVSAIDKDTLIRIHCVRKGL